MVITNRWSGFSLGRSMTDAADTVWFKKVDYKLEPSKTHVNMFMDGIFIYSKYFTILSYFLDTHLLHVLNLFRQARKLKIYLHDYLTYLSFN